MKTKEITIERGFRGIEVSNKHQPLTCMEQIKSDLNMFREYLTNKKQFQYGFLKEEISDREVKVFYLKTLRKFNRKEYEQTLRIL